MQRQHTHKVIIFLARIEVIWAVMAVLCCALAFVSYRLSTTQHATCTQVQALKAQIVTTVTRSLNTLPSITYYRGHPAELAAQLAQAHKTIREFQPSDC